MADYIKREDAMSHPFANGHYDKKHANEDFILGHECYKEWIKTLPAADVAEVVRCKDCRYFDTDALPKESYHDGLCRNYDRGIMLWLPKKDDFCSAGERRKVNMTGNKLWRTDLEAVKILTMIASDRFLTEYRELPTTVIVPVGSIKQMREECSEYISYPDAEPVTFCGLLVRESPRIKSIESLEVY